MIRLHHVPFSRSFRVLWLLEALGLDFEIVEYSIRDGSLRAPGYLSHSPAGRVPALEIDGMVLNESGAIVQYLCERHPESGFGRPAGHPERARFLEAIHFSETMGTLLEQLNLNHIFLRPPAKPSPAVVKLNTRRLEQTLRAFQTMLGDQDFILPSGFSAADMMMGFNIFEAPYYVRFDDLPGLVAYRARLEAQPSYAPARARDGQQDFFTQDFYPIPEEG
ncbi:glutathione S-transferase family protein [Actibacterium sp. XHP0104]|uniref:glutathione S-transferase family protein n=1 Tax=Actibacterium sp. XHP0104 TaxID=2984335 RepID=UPI0021E96B9A|nr:glutathione S-transferase [Actibacterium sp. XHP0104]MCV2880678.1 glutathione S-transferase [Actibacterium sp. XHP0104]